jgi:hypothetical protein
VVVIVAFILGIRTPSPAPTSPTAVQRAAPVLSYALCRLPSLDPHRLAVAAEGADEALPVAAAVHHGAVRQTRNGNGGLRSEVSAIVASLPVDDPVRIRALVFSEDHRALYSHGHCLCSSMLRFCPRGSYVADVPLA